jgi:hypothetical protein
LPDAWEKAYQLGMADATDAGLDTDGDGRTNAQEHLDGTHPRGFYTRYLAEGATGPYFTTRISVANPTTAPATVLLRALTDSGLALPKYFVVPPMAKRSLVVNTDVPGASFVTFATVVEADVEVVVDRTMFWDQRRYGSHAETSIPAPSVQWYLAEGATHGNNVLFYLLQNPSLTGAAVVRVRYLLPSLPPVERQYTVPPHSRLTIQVDDVPGLSETDVSADIRSLNNVPIIVERAMYAVDPHHPALGFVAGHEAAGVTAPSTSSFLAEGVTGSFMDMFLLFANPNATDAVLRVTYLLEGGANVEKTYVIPAFSRHTLNVALEDPLLAATPVATKVESMNGQPVVVERAMWWPHGEVWRESHASVGSTVTGVKWALAEGESGGPPDNTRTYVLVANTSPTMAQVRLTLLFSDGRAPMTTTQPVLPNSRKTFDIGAIFDIGFTSYGMVIESTTGEQIVVERAMYSDSEGVFWAAGTDALATRLR